MRTNGFLEEYHDLICSNYGEEQFAAIKVLCPGLSSPKLGKILNRAAYHLSEDEIYLELGTYVGYTLICASLHNVHTRCVGIDNFKLLGKETTKEKVKWTKERFKTNMAHFNFGNQQVIDSDYRAITSVARPIGVFYVDAEHTREETYHCLEWGHEKLSDEALVFVDDISMWGVGDGIKDWLNEHGDEYYEFFHMDNYYDPKKARAESWSNSFWHGLSILKFKRKK